MANIALDQICESISAAQQGVLDAEAGMTQAAAAGTASFMIGASAGVALQVKNAAVLPSKMKGMLLVPLTLGTLAGSAVYKHYIDKCEEQWKRGQSEVFHFKPTEMTLPQYFAN